MRSNIKSPFDSRRSAYQAALTMSNPTAIIPYKRHLAASRAASRRSQLCLNNAGANGGRYSDSTPLPSSRPASASFSAPLFPLLVSQRPGIQVGARPKAPYFQEMQRLVLVLCYLLGFSHSLLGVLSLSWLCWHQVVPALYLSRIGMRASSNWLVHAHHLIGGSAAGV